MFLWIGNIRIKVDRQILLEKKQLLFDIIKETNFGNWLRIKEKSSRLNSIPTYIIILWIYKYLNI